MVESDDIYILAEQAELAGLALARRLYAILLTMEYPHIPWHTVIFITLKLLKTFGIIPGTLGALWVRKQYQKWRQNRAMAGWQSTEATIQSGVFHHDGARQYWVELTYTYYVEEYRTGKHIHHFHKEDEADDFMRETKGRKVQVRYNPDKPDESVILDRDLEMVAMIAPRMG